MRASSTFPMLMIAFATSGQVLNGSFEIGGAFSIAGWAPTACAVIGSTTDTPDGDHALVMASSSANVCNYAIDSNRLVQALPWVNDGDPLLLQWWWRRTSPNDNAIAWLGTVENGVFTSQYSFTTTSNDWAFFTMEEQIQVAPGQQAALALGGGFSLQEGGSSSYDMVEVSLVTGISETQPRLRMRPNPVDDRLFVEAPGFARFAVIDASGRVHYPNRRSIGEESGTTVLDVADLPAGLYVLEARDRQDVLRSRFIKR
ncbi:MAG: T9SS type A sorting domain-containing protein [Flavobacteriales bacterium]